ncbi:MAG: hypothetical protein ABL957_13885 [Parvularculaceae bacterium]
MPPPSAAKSKKPFVSPGRALRDEPLIDLADIQSDLLLGHSKLVEAQVFFKITDAKKFARFVQGKATPAIDAYHSGSGDVAQFTGKKVPTIRTAVAFSHAGLDKLGRAPKSGEPVITAFKQTMADRAVKQLNDSNPKTWDVGSPSKEPDGVFVVTAGKKTKNPAPSDIAKWIKQRDDFLAANFPGGTAAGFTVIGTFLGNIRPAPEDGHEHFGFLDGVSQPGLRGRLDHEGKLPLTANFKRKGNATSDEAGQGLPGQDLLWPGEFIFGLSAQDEGARDMAEEGPPRAAPAEWRNGAFLVIRRLRQFVPEFRQGVAAAARTAGLTPDLLGTQLVGRWPGGAPLLVHQARDPGPKAGRDESLNNDFEFGGDRGGGVCPWAAHVRKVYPRDEVPGSFAPPPPTQDQVDAAEAFTQQHRLLRRGIQFGPELTADETNNTIEERGLLFKCYVTDLDTQFEFVQRDWANNASFAHGGAGVDPIIGQQPKAAKRPFAGAGAPGSKPQFSFVPWVEMTGGAYFFAPSLSFIRGLVD